ncbi:MAG: hypothetical protein EPN98_21490 [Phenylobacterium sp.]|uniref:hypothetical protein n=1 Tax=Phenylobacterium sp. TaxID=1871053 RepID=UPI001208B659|nr:hypothetical protein [Phenylobacterium sp.]TAL29019.1 MAG: hypothetical protein EPN98_21490 [Phenylobacterium sp.]
MTDDEIQALKAKYAGADLRIISNDELEIEIVVDAKKLAREWPRFRALLQDDAQEMQAHKMLVLAGIVEPSAEAFRALIEERSLPACWEILANQCGKIVGASRATKHKKI